MNKGSAMSPAPIGQRGEYRPTGNPDRELVRGIILTALFFVPDIIASSPVFPIQKVATSSGLDLVALLTPALVGALTVAVSLVFKTPNRRRVAGALGIFGTVAVTLPVDNHLPLSGPFASLLFTLTIIMGIAVHKKTTHVVTTEILVALGPLTALSLVFTGLARGIHSPAYIVSFKAPVILYLMLKSAVFSSVAPKSNGPKTPL
jgi:hypothetical protein